MRTRFYLMDAGDNKTRKFGKRAKWERRAARGRGGTGVGRRRPGASGGMRAVASTLEMGRLETPARGKPHIDQHQSRALRRSVAETAGYIQKRSTDGPLHGRYSGV